MLKNILFSLNQNIHRTKKIPCLEPFIILVYTNKFTVRDKKLSRLGLQTKITLKINQRFTRIIKLSHDLMRLFPFYSMKLQKQDAHISGL